MRCHQAMVGVRDHHFALLQHFILKAHKRGDIVDIGLLQQLVRRSSFFFFKHVAERAAPVSAEDPFKQNGVFRVAKIKCRLYEKCYRVIDWTGSRPGRAARSDTGTPG